jgi:TRAP-type C4-dicarboxylate transport system permease small subunit
VSGSARPVGTGPQASAIRFLERCEEALLAASIAGAFLALVLQVFSRYVFNLPLAWTEELARYLFIWSVFLGASHAMRHGEHIAIGLLVERLPLRTAKAVAILMDALVCIFLLVAAVKGTELAMKVADLPSIALDVSMAAVIIPLPLACTVMLLRTLASAWHTARFGPEAIQPRSL